MTKRSYRQYCGLAVALDVAGQRWAMLVVRDLVPGPRRFTDLFDGLPGISTDLLADRLRSLEAAGAVRQREVKDPAPANLYELTERGYGLARIAGDLARWGGPLLPPPGEATDYVVNARWALSQCAARYRGGFPDGDVHLILDDRDEMTLSFVEDRGRLRYGHTSTDPLMTIEATMAGMLAILRNPPGEVGQDPKGVTISGQADLLRPLLESLRA